jgi:hypothetical protein
VFIEEYRNDRILDKNYGLLQDAGEASRISCAAHPDAVVVLLGPFPIIATKIFPQNIIDAYDARRRQAVSLLALNIIAGHLAVNATFLSSDDRTIAVLESNKWKYNSNNALFKETPDFSSLIVYDQFNKKVVDVRYLNRTTIRVYGTFTYHDQTIIANETKLIKTRENAPVVSLAPARGEEAACFVLSNGAALPFLRLGP